MAVTSYNAIGSITLTSAQPTINFNNIPQIYTDLVIVTSTKTPSGSYPILKMLFNGDTATNYSYTNLIGSATSTVASSRGSSIAQMYPGPGIVTAIPDITSTFATGVINVMNYSNSTTYKTALSRDAVPTGTMGGTGQVGAYVNLWRSTAAVTSITLSTNNGSNYDVGSSFTLYGVGANQLKASGGDYIQTDGTYWYHVFTSTGAFVPNQNLTCSVIAIGGGGSGGSSTGGGGGGAEVKTYSTISTTANTSYTATIGAGGVGHDYQTVQYSGSSSTFSTITALGGGGGGNEQTITSGATGGSGGGGGWQGSGGSASGSNTFAGGNGYNASGQSAGGGGGGATAAGANATNTVAGAGGLGYSVSTLDSSLPIIGPFSTMTYVSSGGGGGASSTRTASAGGTGAGSGTNSVQNGGNATSFGSGGGGGGWVGGVGAGGGGSGKSGVVVVRYAI